MSKNKTLWLFAAFLALCSCSWRETEEMLPLKPARIIYGNEQDTIVLQNLTSRVLATCQSTDDVSADACARVFESKGYVRITNIPYKTADYDFLKTDTYPTRRWRGGEKTPRW